MTRGQLRERLVQMVRYDGNAPVMALAANLAAGGSSLTTNMVPSSIMTAGTLFLDAEETTYTAVTDAGVFTLGARGANGTVDANHSAGAIVMPVSFRNELNSLLDQAIEACAKTLRYPDDAIVDTAVSSGAGSRVIDLSVSARAFDVIEAWWVPSGGSEKRLGKTDLRPLEYTQDTDEPYWYIGVGGRIELYPWPSANGTLRARIVQLPAAIANAPSNDSTVPTLPLSAHDDLARYAAGLYFERFTPLYAKGRDLQAEASSRWSKERQSIEAGWNRADSAGMVGYRIGGSLYPIRGWSWGVWEE